MTVLFRGDHRVTVPDAVASDYEAEGWSRKREPAPQEPEAPAPLAEPRKPRRKASR